MSTTLLLVTVKRCVVKRAIAVLGICPFRWHLAGRWITCGYPSSPRVEASIKPD